MKETSFEKSKRINGFAEDERSLAHYDSPQNLGDIYIDSGKICPVLINSLSEYTRYITDDINGDLKRPIFYRSHYQINYYNVPASLRKGVSEENWIYGEFLRRCPELFKACENTFEKLLLMQHYGSFSRCLDITESPLVALAFACIPEKKFNSNQDDRYFSTITVYKAEDDNDIKYYNSKTTSVLANCMAMDEKFLYGNLEHAYISDGFGSSMRDFIYFRDIVRRSVIVRSKQNNPRILNQRGAFILVNANELLGFHDAEGQFRISCDEFMDMVLNDDEKNLNAARCADDPRFAYADGDLKWCFEFKKVEPYSIDNRYEAYRSDPFDINRLYYKKDGRQLVFFISPYAKKSIRRELENIGYTYDFLYPEPDVVFHEIVEKTIGGYAG